MTLRDLETVGRELEAVGRDLAAFVIFALLVAAAIALFYAGWTKVKDDKLTSASAAMSFGFLLVVILSISQFKHINGFGFEAETWDQKQVEAARLVDQLQGLTKATSRELALVASKIGRWDNGPSNQELMDIINTLTPVLEASGFGKEERHDLLLPIYDRIEFKTAYSDVYISFRMQYNIPESNPCQSTQPIPPEADVYRGRLCDLNKQDRSIRQVKLT